MVTKPPRPRPHPHHVQYRPALQGVHKNAPKSKTQTKTEEDRTRRDPGRSNQHDGTQSESGESQSPQTAAPPDIGELRVKVSRLNDGREHQQGASPATCDHTSLGILYVAV